MSTAIVPTSTPARSLVDVVNYVRPGQRVLVTDVDWEDYERLLAWRDEHRPRSVRLAYDRGRLEIMVVTNFHERLRRVLDMMLTIWITETGGDYVPSGQLTHKREDLEKGFEPDECYSIQNWKKTAGLREIDFTKDPPPDLMIEIEVSRSVQSRLLIIAAFKIPEVWRFDGENVVILLLQPDSRFVESKSSRAVPTIPFSEVAKYLAIAETSGESFASIDRQFRAWVRSLPPAPKS